MLSLTLYKDSHMEKSEGATEDERSGIPAARDTRRVPEAVGVQVTY